MSLAGIIFLTTLLVASSTRDEKVEWIQSSQRYGTYFKKQP